MKFIAISFTLKGQDFAKIAEQLELIAQRYPDKKVILIHGFMPRHVLIEKGFSTEVVDTLDRLFLLQINCNNAGEAMRAVMHQAVQTLEAKVYVVGEVKDGVAEEVELYRRDPNTEIEYYPLFVH